MAVTFGALLYFQIMYLENMVKMRDSQFSETVMKCLYSTSNYMEKREAALFLQEDIDILESNLYDLSAMLPNSTFIISSSSSPLIVTEPDIQKDLTQYEEENQYFLHSPIANLSSRYQNIQEIIRRQYLYQKGLLSEVILNILRESGNRPVLQRADSIAIRNYLSSELSSIGMPLPFRFSISNNEGKTFYQTEGFDRNNTKAIYSQTLFPNSDSQLWLNVEFPSKSNYVFSSVRFIIPTLAFSLILLVIFIFTIFLAWRQKKLSEMKTDFVNNMTHELKTPISTISLAAQMLADDSIKKSPSSLNHISQVITDETKRLRFQVEKVLQMSVFENSSASLKFKETDANNVIKNVVNTFKIKVEKYGGILTCDLQAEDSTVMVDEMHFTNIIYNLLDNAVKYMKPDTKPNLEVITKDTNDHKLKIMVKDNGIGIKKEDLKRIFEKFYRVSTGNLHDVKGFGLGLAYVKKMVTQFHGSINVESEPEKGSTFIITLPLTIENLETDD